VAKRVAGSGGVVLRIEAQGQPPHLFWLTLEHLGEQVLGNEQPLDRRPSVERGRGAERLYELRAARSGRTECVDLLRAGTGRRLESG
jgi:hypothetical protein